jgi:hypothetical protein
VRARVEKGGMDDGTGPGPPGLGRADHPTTQLSWILDVLLHQKVPYPITVSGLLLFKDTESA